MQFPTRSSKALLTPTSRHTLPSRSSPLLYDARCQRLNPTGCRNPKPSHVTQRVFVGRRRGERRNESKWVTPTAVRHPTNPSSQWSPPVGFVFVIILFFYTAEIHQVKKGNQKFLLPSAAQETLLTRIGDMRYTNLRTMTFLVGSTRTTCRSAFERKRHSTQICFFRKW